MNLNYLAVCRIAAAFLLLVPAASVVEAETGAVSLTLEQAEDRVNFIAAVRSARQGDSDAQWSVGSTYAKLGEYTRAFPMLKSAAESGHGHAAELLAWLYEEGLGVEKNMVEAKRWYLFASELGEAGAMVGLGRILLKESEAKANKESLRLFEKAARLEDPNGQYFLGLMLVSRTGESREELQAHAQAHDWFLKSARQGHVGAQLAVASQLLAGRKTAADRKSALQWLQLAAESKDPVAHYLLARLSTDAADVDLDQVQSSYRLAAQAGHREAQFALANMLAKSDIESSQIEAAEWFAKADENGHGEAANRLGELYRDNSGSLVQLEKARTIFLRAAKSGDANAMYNLASMQNIGLGGSRDTSDALKWYSQAAEKGNEKARDVIARLLDSSVGKSDLGLKGFWQ